MVGDNLSCITVLENFLGSEINTENIAEITLLTVKQREELYDVLEQFYLTYELPPKAPNVLRILIRSRGPSRFHHLFEPWVNSNDLDLSIREFTASIANFLLYYHSLVLPDPLNRFFTVISKHRKNVLNSYIRNFDKFILWLTMILTVKKLIQSAVIYLFPNCTFNERMSQVLDRLCYQDMKEDKLMTLVKKLYIEGTPEDDYIGDIPIPLLQLNSMLLQSEFTESNYIARNRKFYNLVLEKMNHIAREIPSEFGIESLNVHSLQNIEVPIFQILRYRELIKMRESEDIFHKWRTDLSRLLSALRTSPFENIKNKEEIQRKADELLYGEYQDLASRISDRKPLYSIRKGIARFGIGTLVLYSFTRSLREAFFAAAGAETVNALYELIFRQPKKGEKLLLKHYTLFFAE